MKKTPVLLVSRDAVWRHSVRRSCPSDELEWLECEDRSQAVEQAAPLNRAVLVFASSDIAGSFEDLQVVRELRCLSWHSRLLLVVTESSEDLAVAALRSGVNDLFRRSEGVPRLVEALRQLLGLCPSPPDAALHPIVGNSRSIQQLRAYLAKVAATDCNVLITGETGTGKELVAETLHRASPRRKKRLVPVNCAAIPDSLVESELFGHERGAFTGAHATREGMFQMADGGTIFLDEIGDMDLGAQAKLLRVIENKEVYTLGAKAGVRLNVRVVAATNRDPEQLVIENRFRKDLYFRLNVARVHLIPLRERKEDIPVLVEHSIHQLNQRFHYGVTSCSGAATALLQRYDWPGNVRELRNLLEATFIELNSPVITPDDFPPAFQQRLETLLSLGTQERDRVLSALSATNWNVSQAAKALHWSRMTLYRKIAKYHMSRAGDLPLAPETHSSS